MKAIIILSLVLSVSNVFADEGESRESRFHLMTTKCEPEAGDSPETTPQAPPLDIDDPSTPGCNRWEVNITFSGNLAQGSKNWELPLLDINYGLGDNIQLKYEVPMDRAETNETSTSTVGDSIFGIKYMFFEDEESKVQISFYPQLQFSTPAAESPESTGTASSGNITTLPLLLSKKIGENSKGDFMFTGNLAYNYSTKADTRNFAFIAAAIGVPLLKKLSMMGELSTVQALEDNSDGARAQLVKANVGLIGTLNKQLLLYGSVGESLYSSDNLNHTYVLAGVRVLTSGL